MGHEVLDMGAMNDPEMIFLIAAQVAKAVQKNTQKRNNGCGMVLEQI